MGGLVHTRKGANQKDLVRGKTKLILKNASIRDWARPERTKDFEFFSEACEAEKGGLTGWRISRKVVLVP